MYDVYNKSKKSLKSIFLYFIHQKGKLLGNFPVLYHRPRQHPLWFDHWTGGRSADTYTNCCCCWHIDLQDKRVSE